MLIEDENDVSKILAFYIKKAGFEVNVAADGEAGLREAREHTPDLIILDLMLPSLSGEEICKALREDNREDLQTIPIIMLTAKSGEVDRIIGKVIGANCYLTKPFEIQLLLSQINRFISSSSRE